MLLRLPLVLAVAAGLQGCSTLQLPELRWPSLPAPAPQAPSEPASSAQESAHGSASVPPAPQTSSAALTQTLNGRFSLSIDADGRKDNHPGRFALQRLGSRLSLDLLSPFGQVIARINQGPEGAVLQRSDGPPLQAADLDAAVADVLGESIPVQALLLWLLDKDQPQPQAPPWRIRVDAHDAEQRPRRIDVDRLDPDGREIKLRLVIDRS